MEKEKQMLKLSKTDAEKFLQCIEDVYAETLVSSKTVKSIEKIQSMCHAIIADIREREKSSKKD